MIDEIKLRIGMTILVIGVLVFGLIYACLPKADQEAVTRELGW